MNLIGLAPLCIFLTGNHCIALVLRQVCIDGIEGVEKGLAARRWTSPANSSDCNNADDRLSAGYIRQ